MFGSLRIKRTGFLLAGLAVATALTPVLAAEDAGLAPLTVLKVSVVQWNPIEGQYKTLDAVSGELTVAPDRTITVPLVGRLPVAESDPDKLAAIIADRIKAKIGLVDLPEVTVAITAYPPIYVIGDVSKSGEYPFRPGMTALQALALGGGEVKADPTEDSERTRLLGSLQTAEGDILRSLAHIARYQAEVDGAASITYPAELKATPDDPRISQIVAQEDLIFRTRKDGLKRQQDSFQELQTLLLSEIDVLEQKGKNLDTAIAAKEQEFSGVKTLVDQGIATITRRTDIETVLTSLRADRLDNVTASMRARQSLSEAQRNLAALLDQYKTDASTGLQAEEAKLEETRTGQATSRLLLMGLPKDTGPASAQVASITYDIVRQQADGGVSEIAADETTQLVPGDVVKIVLVPAAGEAGSAESPL